MSTKACAGGKEARGWEVEMMCVHLLPVGGGKGIKVDWYDGHCAVILSPQLEIALLHGHDRDGVVEDAVVMSRGILGKMGFHGCTD